jgi:hypothetical protein
MKKNLKLDSISVITDPVDFMAHYGLRSYNLWKLYKNASNLDYLVPSSLLISSDLSKEMRIKFSSKVSYDYRLKLYNEYLFYHREELVESSNIVDSVNPPIVRGTSCAEGYKNLSFAGVCHSAIPKDVNNLGDFLVKSTAQVIASVFNPYAEYYFKAHNIPTYGKNIGIIMMEMIKKPIFHATAYVYQSEIRIKYFFAPDTGTIYRGGKDIIISDKNHYSFEKEFNEYSGIWKHTVEVLKSLPKCINGNDNPVDVEFLISLNNRRCELYIVQIRNISSIHCENHMISQKLPNLIQKDKDIIIAPESHLVHSIIDCTCEINLDKKRSTKNTSLTPTFVVKHNMGEGLLSFVKNLPKKTNQQIGIIVSHPVPRTHDHFQYSIYEDQRIKFVIHCNEDLISKLKNGMIVHMKSNGKNATIEPIEQIDIDSVNIKFIADDNSLPKTETVSAVFLVGFKEGKIIAAKNERGWDIPGGHIDPTDNDLFSGLQRESDEEAGISLDSAVPFAVMKFAGKEKVMLFYVSKNFNLGKFIPKEDAFERCFMSIPNFISKYNWNKKIMELIIKKAIERLN